MAASVVATYASTDTSADKSISGIAWNAGDAVVVIAGTGGENSHLNLPTNANLSFSQKAIGGAQDSGNLEGVAIAWGAIAASSQTSQTISVTETGSAGQSFIAEVWVIRPDSGEVIAFGSASGNVTEATISLAVSSGSTVCYLGTDWNADAAGRSPATGSGTPTERLDATLTATYTYYAADWVGVSAGTFGFGMSDYTGWKVAHAALEVTSGPVQATGAASLGSMGGTATGDVVNTSPTVTSLGGTSAAANGTSKSLTLAASVAVGDQIVVVVAIDNTGTNGAAPASLTISDSKSQTWPAASVTQLVDPGAASAGSYLAVWSLTATASMTTSDTITITTGSSAAIGIVAAKVTPITGGTLAVGTSGSSTTTAGTTATITTGTLANAELVFGFGSIERTAAPTADSDTTNGSWSSLVSGAGGNSGTATTNQVAYLQWKLTTASATQTYNTSWTTSTDGCIGYLTFVSVVAATGAAPLGSLGGSAAGTVTTGGTVEATGAGPLGTLGGSATAAVTTVATGAGALGSLGGSATATVTTVATGSAALGSLSGSATGAVVTVATGAGALGSLGGSATAAVTTVATGAAALGTLSGSATGAVTTVATGAAALGSLGGSATGVVTTVATGTASLGSLGGSATGDGATSTVEAIGAAALGSLGGSATGTVTTTAVGSSSLGTLGGSATATPTTVATGAGNLGALGGSAVGKITTSATGVAQLTGITGTATGIVTTQATGAATLGSLGGSASSSPILVVDFRSNPTAQSVFTVTTRPGFETDARPVFSVATRPGFETDRPRTVFHTTGAQ